jgi:ubiquinone/menaquinone biosynthesis C-methylase UbiE
VDRDKVFSGSIAEIYDSYLVPMIFEAYAEDLALRAAAEAPSAVLETAAGSGVVPRALAPRLAPDADYHVTDLNEPMLDRARSRQPPDGRIRWRQADALALPFADRSVDAVLCQFGAMFFPDRPAGFAEARRVLRPGGVFLFNVWDAIAANAFAAVVTDAAAAVFPDAPPRFLARTPHGYHETDLIRRDLAAAGFGDVTVETVEKISVAPTARHPAIAYCQGTPLRNEIEARDPGMLETVTDRAAEAIAERFGHGPVAAPMRAHVVTARA